MRTIVFGKNIENVFKVNKKQKHIKNKDGIKKIVYTDIPVVIKETNIVSNSKICSFKGEPRYNSHNVYFGVLNSSFNKQFNISENEIVIVEKEVFRADLNEVHLFTNKVISETDVNKEEANESLELHIKKFNKQMIESNDKMLSYCRLHKLTLEDTDCVELFKLLFHNNNYEIVDGVMREKHSFYSCENISCATAVYHDYDALEPSSACASSNHTHTLTGTTISSSTLQDKIYI